MERWDHSTCEAFQSLGFGAVLLMVLLAAIAGGLCLFSLGVV